VEETYGFKSYDGTALEGTLAGGDGRGDDLVLMVHGINSSRDELGLFSGFAEYLESSGLPSFRFDYRCHGVNSQPIQSLILSGIVNDIEAAAACALKYSTASRIHVVGMSFGGGLSAFWASVTDTPVNSVTLFAPVIDYEEDVVGQHGLLSNGQLTENAQASLKENGYLETDGVRYGPALINELRYISGVVGLRDLRCNCLIVHGDADSIVPYQSSQRFVKLNQRARLVNIEDTDHGFGIEDDEDLTSPETKAKHLEVFQLVTDFLRSNDH
jgi:pimeloyl-ACP methyl ester carboxylesterase